MNPVIELFVRHLAVHEDTVVVNKAPKLESEHEARFYFGQILSKKFSFVFVQAFVEFETTWVALE